MVPAGLTPQAWHLFAIFLAAIFALIVGAFPVLTASILALATRKVTPFTPVVSSLHAGGVL